MAAKRAAGGFVVTSGRFTQEAEAFAKSINIQLLDGAKLQRLLKVARASSRTDPPMDAEPARRPTSHGAVGPVPDCPRCAQPMVRRTAKKGVNAGNEFWGCRAYPRCRGTG